MTRAVWNGEVIAESDNTVMVEGNRYFPPDSVKSELLVDSPTSSVCPWKGTASYYDIVVEGETNAGAAWYYPDPKPEAAEIKDHVAFWNGVKVEV
ncbi:MAG: DUF427 domain-containing protein [Thermoleophilia bacterium]|nr:DUF427 domain-containing protein [Thermoleophilia bacterium]MDH3724683.1 DUF427 domain-containing protein [Thermoleophilia bacterium]